MLILLLSIPLMAGELESLIEKALRNNKLIEAYDLRKKAFLNKGKFYLSLPNPQIRFTLRNFDTEVPIARKENPMSSYAFTLSQAYILREKRERKYSVFEGKALEVDARKKVFLNEIRRDLSLFYYDFLLTLEKEKILKEILRDLKLLKDITEEKYSYGKALLSDLLLLKGEILKTERAIEKERAKREEVLSRIYALTYEKVPLRGERLTLMDFPKAFDPERSVYMEVLKRELERIIREYRYAKVIHKPDINFLVDYAVRPDLPDMFSVGVAITLPVWYERRERFLVLEAKERIEAKKREIENLKVRLREEFEGLKREYNLLKETLYKLRKEIEVKKAEIGALFIAYKYDKIDVREILRAYRILWKLKLDEVSLITYMNKLVVKAEALL
ncbi:TolC family protein [Aquifex pyrophilus]